MILRKRSRSCGLPLRSIVRSAQPTPAQWMHVRSGAISTAAATAARTVSSSVTSASQKMPPMSDATALPLVGVAVDHDHVRALGREPPAGCLAHSRCPARDDGRCVLE